MSLEISIREICGHLRSDRQTERKKNAEALKAYLSNDTAPALLSENTIKKSGYGWNNLFDDINEFILKECEKFETSRTFDNTKHLCTNLLHSTVAGSNKDKAYIKSEKITDACLLILKSNRFIKAFGDSFLNLLYKHVMPYEHYLGSISPDIWKDLLETCTVIYCSGHSIIDDFTFLRLILLIIQNAVNYCQFVGPLADILPQLQKCYVITRTDKRVQEVLVEIAVILSEQLASECRLTTCEFTEKVIPVVIRWYDQNADIRKKERFFKLLQTSVMLHHPLGRLQSEEGSLAVDWTIWNNQMNNIAEIIQLEINCLQKALDSKFKFQNENPALKLCSPFVELAATVYYLICNTSDQVAERMEEPSAKRPRLSTCKFTSFNDLIQALQQNHFPWLRILYIYTEQYSQSVSACDWTKLLIVLETYITNNNTNFNWGDFKNITTLSLRHLKEATDLQESPFIVSLWNTCIRYSASVNAAHDAVYSIIHTILDFGILNNKQIVPLVKLYNEKAVPVTDSSVFTLNKLIFKHFSTYNDSNDKIKCFSWFMNGDYTAVNEKFVKELLIRLIAKDNIVLPISKENYTETDILYDTLFNSIQKSILLTEFELELNTELVAQNSRSACEQFEPDHGVNERIGETLNQQLKESFNSLKNKQMKLIEFIKIVQVSLQYCNILIKFKIISAEEIPELKVYNDIRDVTKYIFILLAEMFDNNKNEINLKVDLLQCVQNIFIHKYEHVIQKQIRMCVNENFFHTLEKIISSEVVAEDGMYFMDDDNKVMESTLRFNCIYLLASYCRINVMYRNELLDFILNSALYNFGNASDLNTAIKCMKLLNGPEVEEPPIDSLFSLLRVMCKELFRNTKATFKILEHLVQMLDNIFLHSSDNTRSNCLIMIKGYLARCEKLYYPPHTAAMIYKCVARMETIKQELSQTWNDNFQNCLLRTVNNNVHSLRLYCCYLLTKDSKAINTILESNMTLFIDIFLIDVLDKSQIFLKDELANRTSTVLHCFFALAISKPNLTLDVVKHVLELHKIKKLNDAVVKKVLNKISNVVASKSLDNYLIQNLMYILQYWFSKKHSIQELPIVFFGFKTFDKFVEKHMCLLLPAELLWSKQGNLNDSEIIKIMKKHKKTNEMILENCFSDIIAICLPYMACDKYNIGPNTTDAMFHDSTQSARYLFPLCRQVLGNDRWSTLFMDHIGQVVLATTVQLHDSRDIKIQLDIDISHLSTSSYYTLEVFECVLKYIDHIIDTDVLLYLADKQPLAMSKICIKLWTYVTEENIFDLKIIALHRFIVVFKKIPTNSNSDGFVCNFACNNLMYAIKQSNNKKEILTFAKALHIVLDHLLPQKLNVIRKVMPQIISTLIIKKEEGYGQDCMILMNYLLVDMKGHLKDSIDLVDGSQHFVENSYFSTKGMLTENLNMFVTKLSHYSFETLCNLKDFLRNNKGNVLELYKELHNIKGFSEDCNGSLIHQLMNSLIGIVKSSADSQTVLEACNCLAEIGMCDLKTLVMMTPNDNKKVLDVNPSQFFALVLIQCLSNIIFDQCPSVVDYAVNALTSLLKYKEGKVALEFGEVDKDILRPFLTTKATKGYAAYAIDNGIFDDCKNLSVWVPDEDENYLEWLKKLTTTLLNTIASDDNYLSNVLSICEIKPSVCKELLPPLLGLILFNTSDKQTLVFSAMIHNFFQYFVDKFRNGYVEDSNDILRDKWRPILTHKHKCMVQSMLEVVDFIRLQRSHYKKWSNHLTNYQNYLNLDYKAVAWAANVADKSVTAIYYGELWCMIQNNGVPPASPEDTSKLENGETIQKVLQKAFISIGEMDAMDGCGTDHLTDEGERRRHLLRCGRPLQCLMAYELALSCPRAGDVDHAGHLAELHRGTVNSLHQAGMYHVALHYINSLPDSGELDDIKYDCCTQLGDWSIFVDTTDLEFKAKTPNVNLESIIKAFRYACLKDCLTLQIVQEQTKSQLLLERAKTVVSLLCQKLNMDNCQNVYKVVSKLQLLKEIEEYYLVRCEKALLSELIQHWQISNLPSFGDLKYVETLLFQRSLILEHAAKSNSDLRSDILKLQLNYAELLLENGKSEISQRFMAVAKKLQDSGEVSLVEGQVAWRQGHKDIALSLIRKLTLESSDNTTLNATALRQYGNWMVESKYESGKEIIDKYLKRSLEVLGPNGHVETRLKVYFDIAKFADTEYKQVSSYMKSNTFMNKVKCMENMKGSATSLRNSQPNISNMTRDEKKALLTNEKLSTLDEAEIESTYTEKKRFLRLAMRYYLLSLTQGEENNLSVFRVISLWLENPMLECDDDQDGSTFEQLLRAVPSRKYLPVLPQLAPRLTDDNNQFDINLNNILSKCAMDHPHHTLPILFGLKNSHKDLCIAGGAGTCFAQETEPRVRAAGRMVHALRDADRALADVIAQMDRVCDAIISFAYFTTKSKQERQNIPRSESIVKLKNLNSIPVPTITLAVRNDCTYTDFVSIATFADTFQLVGGINCPKKMSCKGSDGKDRTILIKGEDDLRQDAVMQQVFTIVNTLLETNSVTSKYKLLIRTYKVVPLSKRSGVLEWCEGTLPLGIYLVGTNKAIGAHSRYRPMDISCQAARSCLQACHEKRKSNAQKLEVFTKVLDGFKPVFHHFFTEHYLDPVTWYERRQAYVKSVAASSMVGYILGLGDRHVQNILIDTRTAEVIHIDFGIAFDQGKALPTPETVPFRLTQDIIAGFGPSGVEGNFRRCCEKTMQLLRDNQETLLTILEVLLCDPLYTWSLTPAQAKRKQNIAATSRESNAHGARTTVGVEACGPASRALLAVGSKLSGAEGGAARACSVPGQVARLLRHAADPANLCRLYPGWQPYL